MKILAVSDKISQVIYSQQIRDRYGDVDLVISCGDLPFYYLEFIVTMLPVPVFYVFGNHHYKQITADGRTVKHPEGCESLEENSTHYNGLLMAGLGGSMKYNPSAPHQYSDFEMKARILRLTPQLMLNKMKYGRYLDVLVTHSPPFGIHDGTDLPHTGFKSFLTFTQHFKPKYLLHGHKHVYRKDVTTNTMYEDTEIINVYPHRLIEIEDRAVSL